MDDSLPPKVESVEFTEGIIPLDVIDCKLVALSEEEGVQFPLSAFCCFNFGNVGEVELTIFAYDGHGRGFEFELSQDQKSIVGIKQRQEGTFKIELESNDTYTLQPNEKKGISIYDCTWRTILRTDSQTYDTKTFDLVCGASGYGNDYYSYLQNEEVIYFNGSEAKTIASGEEIWSYGYN